MQYMFFSVVWSFCRRCVVCSDGALYDDEAKNQSKQSAMPSYNYSRNNSKSNLETVDWRVYMYFHCLFSRYEFESVQQQVACAPVSMSASSVVWHPAKVRKCWAKVLPCTGSLYKIMDIAGLRVSEMKWAPYTEASLYKTLSQWCTLSLTKPSKPSCHQIDS